MNENNRSNELLKYYQSLPLEVKVRMTKNRIREFLDREDAYVSFSGGKDSTVLAHLVHQVDKTVPLVFSNTGLEYADIQSFARRNDAVFVRPQMRFDEVITKYGYPIISKEVSECIYYARKINNSRTKCARTTVRKQNELNGTRKISDCKRRNDGMYEGFRRKVFSDVCHFGEKSLFNKQKWKDAAYLPFRISHVCCSKMKKSPMQKYATTSGKYPIIGTLTDESRMRKQAWIRHGCNAFEGKVQSQPLSFWTEQDILHYIKLHNLEIAKPYGDIVWTDDDGNDCSESLDFNADLHCTGCKRTGCVYCCFGAHAKGDNRFIELKKIAPRQFEYAFGGGQWVDNPDYDPDAPEYDGEWRNWNPERIWTPSKEGLGLQFVIDSFNELYPKNKIQY